ncbi:MAG: replication-associated recombination protein A [Alphaproteobacteria bacterium]|jgi:putative ATPase|nr:replication-associated recombination protein A [Alphaproteobacteria bacterium]MCB1550606.1 replication-associated recombination protein A [Alphaproteobacteria bacterium]MCB9985471.1 replication-associated recombination protein A [Micavibrio sp.]HPQ50357.1 replication-associated recombination protein A [Alphaproteobacteria bacterium]HRK98709.1 replication-associated recombination protein A [Alphaproteobacteria bacterium]
MPDLFQNNQPNLQNDQNRPLADLLRPKIISEIVGQDHLVSENAPLSRILKSGKIPSLIFWGPPGCGKTTLARLLADHTDLYFEQISAIFSGVADLKKVFETAKIRKSQGHGTLLFVDEIHRFNKSQQDAFLPVVENGTIILIGATTENPSFELNAALLSRTQVLVLKRLDDTALDQLITRAENHAARPLPLTREARESLKALADGDGRYLLTLADQILSHTESETDPETQLDQTELFALVQKRAPLYDKGDDAHYNLISALHKSIRGSDVNAALYWFSRMLDGGEDPRYIARRMVRMAAEDIGLADPQAMPICLVAWDTYERLGSPEGELALSQALIYLATAPKSNGNYIAYKAARRAANEHGSLMPPKHILNAPTKLMKQQGYGTGYQYDHDAPDAFSGQNYFPDDMPRTEFYSPPDRGFEREINKRLAYWDKLRNERMSKP